VLATFCEVLLGEGGSTSLSRTTRD
jgi:hypothetical protein